MDRVRVLLVEDDEDDALLIRDMLEEDENRHYAILPETRLDASMVRAARGEADVALLDLFLPDSRGESTYRKLRRANVALPVIVLTGLDDETLAARALQGGCQDYLTKGRIEPAGLARAIVYAIERKRMEGALIRSERFAAVGTMISGVAHEFNNLNNIVQNSIGLVLKKHPQEERAERKLRMALDASGRAASIIRELLSLSRGGGSMEGMVRLGESIRRVTGLMERDLHRDEIELCMEIDAAPSAPGSPAVIEQILRSLLSNAVHALRGCDSKRIVVQAGRDGAEEAFFRVRDTGCGIPRNEIDHIFTPFYSTKGARGTGPGENESTCPGLGLSLCQSLAQNLGGRIEVESEEGSGTTFTVYLAPPRQESPPRESPSPLCHPV